MYTVDQYMRQNGKTFWAEDHAEPDETYENWMGYRSLSGLIIHEDIFQDQEMVKLFATAKKKKKKTPIEHAWETAIENAWED